MICKVKVDDEFDDESLQVGHIIKYKNDNIQVPTEDAHPHIVIALDGKWCYTVCGSSKKETVIKKSQLKHRGDMTLYPVIPANHRYFLRHDTYFYCEDIYEIHCNELMNKYQNGEIVEISSRLSYIDYQSIISAVEQSETCDIADLFIKDQVAYDKLIIASSN